MAAFMYSRVYKITRPTARCFTKLNYSKYDVKENQAPKKINLEDKVAVITGGASGIGYAIAKEFLNEGMSALTIVDNDKAKALESVKKLTDEHGEDKVLFVEADVGNSKQMDWVYRSTVLHYETIDIIVNSAGVMNDTGWEQQIKTNLHGCIIGTLMGMQYMAKSSSGYGGIVVNIGSIMSIIPSCGFPVYTMTQFGIAGFSKALGSSTLFDRTSVKVFGYCPGLTDTNLIKNPSDNCINDNFAREFQEEIENCVIQKPENVARGLVKILDKAKPGSIWVAENDADPYEVTFPDVVKIKEKKSEVQ